MNIGELINHKTENEHKICELIQENNYFEKLISNGYLDYLKEQVSMAEDTYVCVDSSLGWCNFYHLGKFKYFSFLGEKDKKRLPKYVNDYEAHFEFVDGFTTDLKKIANNNLSVEINEEDSYFEINSDIKDGIFRFRDATKLCKKEFEESKKEIIKKVNNFAKNCYKEYKCGDIIEYANKLGIFTGKIVMIRGKTAFLSDGMKILLSTPRVRKCVENFVIERN